ncbi:hypothetical protein LF41_1732 [Lysobacter dokdonensis DS-58]|uniref:PhoU domain-containing protein n=1 Tax=Lysobacter dokdonensis DS-58 TaxID=1300345 RepID=A0A0A2WDR8_9GAMM|nr:PhoU domain-containing protein [Lysobacter dokdonensis]KGQ17878.1 hypothetical protein LF41_1732 [Lysobacter dokdonensis DS-58]
MSTNFENKIEIFEAMASALRVLTGRLAEVAREATHEQIQAKEDGAAAVARLPDDLELKALKARPEIAVDLIRMIGDVRRISELVDHLAARTTLKVPAVSAEMDDRLRRIFDLTGTLLGETQDAIASRGVEQARAAARRESELDDWYDLLLTEMFEDVVEEGAVPPQLHDVAATAKLLERVGGSAVELAQGAARVLGRSASA